MSAANAPRFDESLASVAQSLHLPQLVVMAMAVGFALFAWLERRGRSQWTGIPMGRLDVMGAPYRESSIVSAHLPKAPRLVRAAALTCLSFGLLFAPLIVLALVKYPFDGIAIPLVPGLALVSLNWACGCLLLSRSSLAHAMGRSGAVGSLMANVGLLGIAGAHFVVVELQRRDGIEHACSSSVTFVVIVFALSSVVQSLLMMAALQTHRDVLEWQPSGPGPAAAING